MKECNGKMILESRGETTSLYCCSECGMFEEIENSLASDEVRCRYTETDRLEIEEWN